MPPGLFMPHTLMGAMPMQQQQQHQSAAQRGVDGEDDGAGAAEGGGGRPVRCRPMRFCSALISLAKGG